MRYLPQTDADRAEMLALIGAASIDDLYVDVPRSAWLDGPVDLPPHQGELQVERAMAAMAGKNLHGGNAPFFVGCGAYRHHVPASVDALIQRGEFLTSYTPYQPEVSQGTLQMLFEFQTMVAMLTGMDVANASMYDGASGTAEAVLMANRSTRRHRAVLSGGLHPHYREAVETYARYGDFEIASQTLVPDGVEDLASLIDDSTSCVVVQTPDIMGRLHDLRGLAEACHAAGALLVVVVTEIVSLGLVRSPGDMGADIVVCEGQSIGNPMGFGGPYLGLFATRDKYVRQMPGRLVGETADSDGKRGYVLTLSTREQHIRREKATSNICTNSGLCALAFTIHLALLGEAGMMRLARLNHEAAQRTAERLATIDGVTVLNESYFNEFTVRLSRPAADVIDALVERGVLGGVPISRFEPDNGELADLMVVAATEMTTVEEIDALGNALAEVLS
ncbi:MAG: aminomethyl-transferring glycine dehydrogenase subunit GcvPA [Alphaproteobacteria bacterium]|jgi:glycine dehydrogenase subunit 1|nr:aminomethyl-transferring glycine dehydrogenase subunit GcvPA [Rhodospirillaceae bacterium]MBT7613909.1 aminomethyl-transferring glycine dehydrogenase subunit GcvPA [Rhodospirillaceae bacterium]MBT7647736.1 aminomethyl-transferring glycine dehydrogenase subunit GcvPA [Rhodospirillaceae bacterium]MDG2480215.1 aminomethyl-transferring glycine dehydrogenase subunit GcvPA [Alphaproteobacteria bacterium]